MVIEGTFGNAAVGGNLINGGFFIPLLREEYFGRVQDVAQCFHFLFISSIHQSLLFISHTTST
jgi:hypothetical protein